MRTTQIVLLITLLAACGSSPAAEAPTAAPAPAAATSAPTAAPKPTSAPAANTGPGLGISRAVLQSKFEGETFNVTFQDDPSAKDGPAVKGTSAAKGITVWLRGASENIQEAQIQVIFDEGATSEASLRHMIALLEVAAPGIKNPTTWLAPHLDRALKEKTDTTIEGGRAITIIATQKPTIIILSILPAPK